MATPFLISRPGRGAGRFFLALICLSFSVAGAEQRNSVQRNDTLTDLAHKYRLTVHDLAERNGLARTDKLRVGQILLIPESETSAAGVASSALLPKGLNRIRIEPAKWKYIVIHHSASPNASVKGMDYYHRVERHMENGLAYHFVIGNGHAMRDGEIAIGHRWTAQLDGGHLASEELNRKAIGICMVGNYDEGRPSKKQMESLRVLVDFLLVRCHLHPGAVRTHQQINPVYTRCPGRNFPAKTFLSELNEENSNGLSESRMVLR